MAKKIKAAKPLGSTGNSDGMNQQLWILGGMIVAVLVVVGIFIVINLQSAGEAQALGENENYAGIPLAGEYAEARTIERGSDVAETVSMGVTEDGYPYVGNIEAPILIGEFADFTCPACTEFSDTAKRVIRDFSRSGDTAYVYFPYPLPGHEPEASISARAAVCAVQQGGFWELHDELFRIHKAESPSSFTPARMEEAANSLGLEGGDIRSCMNTNFADTAITNSRRLGQEVGVTGTPTLVYSVDGGETWLTLPADDGSTSGGRSYDSLAQLIRRANESTGG